jgi:Integrase zinc binding domain
VAPISKGPPGRLARWRLRLEEYEFTIQYRPGIKNSLADGCSRVISNGSDATVYDDTIPCFTMEEEEESRDTIDDTDLPLHGAEPPLPNSITMKELYDEQQTGLDCQQWRTQVERSYSTSVIVRKGGYPLLHRYAKLDDRLQLCVPDSLRTRVLRLGHYPPGAGHPGGRKLYYTLRQQYYWPSMTLDCFETVKNCLTCAKERISLIKRRKYIVLFPAEGSLEYVAIDILGPLPKTREGVAQPARVDFALSARVILL